MATDIQLKDFANNYNSIVTTSSVHDKLLFKCLSDYKNNVANNSVCFTVSGGQIKDKNGISFTTLPDAYKNLANNQIKFSDIQDKINSSSNNISLTFMDDWKDLRTSLGSIPIQTNGGYDMNRITSDNIQYFKDNFKHDIEDKHDDIIRQRNNLDNKMRELYGEPNDADFNSETSIYSTMLFTILTTSLLYYLFIKM
jgi:hypothetical protein